MATLVNIRIHTQSKAVPNAGYIAIDKVMMEGNTIVAMGGDVRYVLGVVPMENIVVDTPSAPEECGCNTTNANIFATLIKGVDGVTPDMSDYYDKSVIDEKLGKKQDAISDIDVIRRDASKGATALQSVPSEYVTETELQNKGYATTAHVDAKQDKISDLVAIRQGADKGATAVQPASLADYISKDDVDAELSETSTNPIQNQAVMNTLLGLVAVLEGIIDQKQPTISDLEAIREGAAKGATSAQLYITPFDVLSLYDLAHNPQEVGGIQSNNQAITDALTANKIVLVPYAIGDESIKGYAPLVGYVEDLLYFKVITDSYEIYVETSRDADDILGQQVTYRDWYSKQDTLVSGENIKTINGESILGSGDIVISEGGGVSGSAQLPANYISSNVPQLCTIPSGKVTIFSTPQTEGVKMQLSTVDMEPDKDNAWVIRLSIGTDNTSAYVVRTDDNSTIKWANGIAPTFENGKTYELSFRKIGSYFLGVWASFE